MTDWSEGGFISATDRMPTSRFTTTTTTWGDRPIVVARWVAEIPDSALSDLRLARLIERWPALPEAVREAIVAVSSIETGMAMSQSECLS